jgi:hypothetical protein
MDYNRFLLESMRFLDNGDFNTRLNLLFLGIYGLILKIIPDDITPYIVLNIVSSLLLGGALIFLYQIYTHFFSNKKMAMLLTLLFNFHPQVWTSGAAVYGLSLFCFLASLSVLCFVKKKWRWAILFSLASCQAWTLGLVVFAATLIGVGTQHLLDHKNRPSLYLSLRNDGLFTLLFLAVFIGPHLYSFGLGFLSNPYYTELAPIQKWGAFLVRVINLFGPLGLIVFLVLGKPFLQLVSNLFYPKKRAVTALLGSLVLFTLVVTASAPWESYYFIILVPIGLGLFAGNPVALGLIAMSMILSNFVQFQFKPWKPPFFFYRPGVIPSHLIEDWHNRSGA